MKRSVQFSRFGIIAILLFVTSCKPTITPVSSPPALTPTAAAGLIAVTPAVDTPTPTATAALIAVAPDANTPTPTPTVVASSEELCDNDYFPSDDDATWVYAGNNSKTGNYTRTDTVIDSRDDGFTIQTKLDDVTYTQEFTCTEAGLINLEPGMNDLAAIFSGTGGTVTLKREHNSGITLPRNFMPGNTWQQFLGWLATGPESTSRGSFPTITRRWGWR